MLKITIKRIIYTAASILFAVALAVTAGVLSNLNSTDELSYSETFTGYLSDNFFPTREATAKAFVDEQLGGKDVAIYSDLEIKGELSQEEIHQLNSPDSLVRADALTITSGEHCEVVYTFKNQRRRVKTDLVYTDEEAYRYYARLPEVGEQPTKAYIDSVFKGDNYLNCSARSQISVSMLGTYSTYLQTILFADDKAYFNQELPGFISEVYLSETEGGITAYLKDPVGDKDDKFYTIGEINAMHLKDGYVYELYLTKGGDRISLDSLKSMEDVADFAFLMDTDCSYFIKTEYGFKMDDDRYKELCRAIAGNEFADDIDKVWHDYKINFHADYYVSEGRLNRMEVCLQMAYDNDLIAMNIITSYSDFGTTQVNFPQD